MHLVSAARNTTTPAASHDVVPVREPAAERALRVVRASGGRLTAPTRMVIDSLADSSVHLTAEDLINEVEGRLPGISPSTVYRVIQRLTELGVVEHVHTSVGPPIYHLRENGHAHLVCNVCGHITDIADGELAELRQTLSGTYGFTLDAHHSALVGRCDSCAPARPEQAAPA